MLGNESQRPNEKAIEAMTKSDEQEKRDIDNHDECLKNEYREMMTMMSMGGQHFEENCSFDDDDDNNNNEKEGSILDDSLTSLQWLQNLNIFKPNNQQQQQQQTAKTILSPKEDSTLDSASQQTAPSKNNLIKFLKKMNPFKIKNNIFVSYKLIHFLW